MSQGSKALASNTVRMARNVALTNAGKLIGGNRRLADTIKVSERSVRAWLGGEREISNGVLTDAAAALEAHACKCREEARKLRELGGAGHLDKDAIDNDAGADRVARFRALPRDVQLRVAKGELELDAAEREAGGQ